MDCEFSSVQHNLSEYRITHLVDFIRNNSDFQRWDYHHLIKAHCMVVRPHDQDRCSTTTNEAWYHDRLTILLKEVIKWLSGGPKSRERQREGEKEWWHQRESAKSGDELYQTAVGRRMIDDEYFQNEWY